ncbi:helix-turn-helix transcriptional regulator [Bartonella sp. CB178]|uniref:helix-turn-helix transcriptional regulator n=1 Tax=Bartonella sp. CB178 TaxID=3112255 RepID=UPI00300DF0D8
MNQREDFKSLIKSVRIKFNLTQSEMAKMLGVTQAAVCKWEKRGSISLINYLKLQKKLAQLPDCPGSMSSLAAVSTVNDEHQQFSPYS